MKITVEFELPDNYAACFCNDEDRIDSLIGSVDKDFTYSIIPSELLEQRDELFRELKKSLEIIRLWHGDKGINIYLNHSPEMKSIREAIKKATS